MRLRFLSAVAALCFAAATFAFAQSDEGPKHHHDEGETLGKVNFPTSCLPAVQKDFERGLALQHSFWYEEAEKQFKDVAARDPKCAMAHWGVAMSLYHQLWARPDAADLKTGWAELEKAQRLKAGTKRERDYIAALMEYYRDPAKRDHQSRAEAYSAAMKELYRQNPEDHEAAAFYALSLLASEPPNDTSFANRKKAIPILNELFAKDPNHPGLAHYLIHSCDKPQLAAMGLEAARRYAKIAPSSPHALHMPSHIFIRLGLWQEAIDSNLASIAATRKTVAMHMGGGGHQFHAMDFAQYAYMQIGQDAKAKALRDEALAMGGMHEGEASIHQRLAFGQAEFAARYAMERHQWAEAAKLEPPAGAEPDIKGITYYAKAIGAARSGDLAGARAAQKLYADSVAELKKSAMGYMADSSDVPTQTIAAWAAFAEGKRDEALIRMRAAADIQDARGLNEVDAPEREMLADMLLEMERPMEALAEYEATLKEAPGRFNTLYGAARAAELAKQQSKAATYYSQLIKNCQHADTDRPELVKAKKQAAFAFPVQSLPELIQSENLTQPVQPIQAIKPGEFSLGAMS